MYRALFQWQLGYFKKNWFNLFVIASAAALMQGALFKPSEPRVRFPAVVFSWLLGQAAFSWSSQHNWRGKPEDLDFLLTRPLGRKVLWRFRLVAILSFSLAYGLLLSGFLFFRSGITPWALHVVACATGSAVSSSAFPNSKFQRFAMPFVMLLFLLPVLSPLVVSTLAEEYALPFMSAVLLLALILLAHSLLHYDGSASQQKKGAKFSGQLFGNKPVLAFWLEYSREKLSWTPVLFGSGLFLFYCLLFSGIGMNPFLFGMLGFGFDQNNYFGRMTEASGDRLTPFLMTRPIRRGQMLLANILLGACYSLLITSIGSLVGVLLTRFFPAIHGFSLPGGASDQIPSAFALAKLLWGGSFTFLGYLIALAMRPLRGLGWAQLRKTTFYMIWWPMMLILLLLALLILGMVANMPYLQEFIKTVFGNWGDMSGWQVADIFAALAIFYYLWASWRAWKTWDIRS